MVELGKGQLSWARFERQTDRYGAVFLCTGPDGEVHVTDGDELAAGADGR